MEEIADEFTFFLWYSFGKDKLIVFSNVVVLPWWRRFGHCSGSFKV